MQKMAVITRIVEAKGKGQRRRVYLDGKFAFTIKLNVVARFRLREGMTLSSEWIHEIEVGEVRQDRVRAWSVASRVPGRMLLFSAVA